MTPEQKTGEMLGYLMLGAFYFAVPLFVYFVLPPLLVIWLWRSIARRKGK